VIRDRETMTQEGQPKIVVIAGPTASGKSGLAVDLALSLSGEIVNADSMQVYRGMDIGTAKPTADEQKSVPHHLLDVVDPDEAFNAALYRRKALPVIADICSRGKTCLVVGGTGLYIRALLRGLMEAPPSDPELRKELHREWQRHGPGPLHERLRNIDPVAAASIHPNDRTRIIRAIEVASTSGRMFSDLTKTHGFRDLKLRALQICLHMERDLLYERINKRTQQMISMGLIEETRALLKNGYSPELKPMKAIGYRHIIRYLQGKWSLEEAIACLQRDTRRYAKRQLTWFRAEPDAIWIDPRAVDMVLDKIHRFLASAQ